jgi:hypothetical protein
VTRTGINTAPGLGPALDVVHDPNLDTDVPSVALRAFDVDGDPVDLLADDGGLRVGVTNSLIPVPHTRIESDNGSPITVFTVKNGIDTVGTLTLDQTGGEFQSVEFAA